MESKIYNFFVKIFSALAIWFDASIFGKCFSRISAFFAKVFTDSALGKLFAEKKNEKDYFSGSIFIKILGFPVFVLKKIAHKISNSCESVCKKSVLFYLVDNFELISSKIYGSITLSFSLMHFIVSLALNKMTPITLIADLGIALLSAFLILLDRSLKSLFKGSFILMSFGGLFTNVKKESSKLFLSENELELGAGFVSVLIGAFAGIFAAILPFRIFVLLLGGIVFVLLSFKYVELSLFTAVIGSPFLPTMALVGLSLLSLLSLGLKIATDKNFKLQKNPLDIYVIFFILASFFGCINSFDFLSSAKIFLVYFSFIMFYFVITNTLTTAKKWKSLVTSFVLVGMIVALYGVLQNFIGVSSTQSWVDKEMFSSIKTRVYSTFDNPNVLGEFLVIMIPTTIALIWGNKHLGHKGIYSLIVLIMCACMVFTWSRGAWLGVALAVMMFFFIMDKRWTLALVCGLFFVPMVLASGSAIVERLLSVGNTKDTSTAYRVSIWIASVRLIKTFWMSGIGLGSAPFTMIYPKFALAGANFALHSHNLFLQICVEMGIIGITSFFALIIAFFRQAYSVVVYRARSRFIAICVIAMASGVLGYMFQGLTDNVWYNYRMMFIFWVIISLTVSGAKIIKNNNDLPKSF